MSAIRQALDRMDGLLEGWDAAGDYRGVFLRAYRDITARLDRAIDAGEFEDNPWMERLDLAFAEEYFAALRAYDSGQGRLARCWQLALDANRGRQTSALQDLLLGMNAHIRHDLPIAIHEVGVGQGDERARHHRDHDRLNGILAAQIDTVQRDIRRHYSVILGLADLLAGATDELLSAAGIRAVRNRAWEDALALAEAGTGPARERIRQELDRRVSATARTLYAPTRILGPVVGLVRRLDRALARWIRS